VFSIGTAFHRRGCATALGILPGAENLLSAERPRGLAALCLHDYLTGLRSAFFEQQLDLELKRAQRHSHSLPADVDIDPQAAERHLRPYIGDQALRGGPTC